MSVSHDSDDQDSDNIVMHYGLRAVIKKAIAKYSTLQVDFSAKFHPIHDFFGDDGDVCRILHDDNDDDDDDNDNDDEDDDVNHKYDDEDDDDVVDIEVGHLVRLIKTWRQRWPAAKLRYRWGEARFHFVLFISQVINFFL